MKKLYVLILLLVFVTSCGHNVLSDYKVKGVDLSIPIFGYPFGVRIGSVEVNSNMIRGNSSYSLHNNSGTDIATGAMQSTSVIQFSSNAQVNEGSVTKILECEAVSDDVKKSFINDYLTNQNAPEVLPVSTKSALSATVANKDKDAHNVKIEKRETLFTQPLSIVKSICSAIGNFFMISVTGRIILYFVYFIALLIIYLFLRDIFIKIWNSIISMFKKLC
jgi:hypothetical protein